MGDSLAIIGLLADTATSVRRFVDVFVGVYILLVFAFILTSWIRLPYQPWLNRAQRFLYDVCDPYLRIFRRFVPPLGPLDLSPMVAILTLVVIQWLLDSHRLLKIVGGGQVAVEQRALFAIDQLDPATLRNRFGAQRRREVPVDRQCGQVGEQRGAAVGIRPGEERRPERPLAALGDERRGGEAVGMQPGA